MHGPKGVGTWRMQLAQTKRARRCGACLARRASGGADFGRTLTPRTCSGLRLAGGRRKQRPWRARAGTRLRPRMRPPHVRTSRCFARVSLAVGEGLIPPPVPVRAHVALSRSPIRRLHAGYLSSSMRIEAIAVVASRTQPRVRSGGNTTRAESGHLRLTGAAEPRPGRLIPPPARAPGGCRARGRVSLCGAQQQSMVVDSIGIFIA